MWEKLQKRFADYKSGRRPVRFLEKVVQEQDEAIQEAFVTGYQIGQEDLRNEARGILQTPETGPSYPTTSDAIDSGCAQGLMMAPKDKLFP